MLGGSVISSRPTVSLLLQNRIGADIIMALDDVVRTTITGPRIEEAMYRTLRWIDRCIAGHWSCSAYFDSLRITYLNVLYCVLVYYTMLSSKYSN